MMWRWIKANAAALEASGALLTAFVALAALIAVKLQIDASERIQKAQAAKEIYREYLNITIQNPKLSIASYCAIDSPKERAAYETYVEYLLYTAEQLIEMDANWARPMATEITRHKAYICSRTDWDDYAPAVSDLVGSLQGKICHQVATCPSPEN